MKFKWLLTLSLFVVLYGCSKNKSEDRILLSIENQTDILLENVSTGNTDFGDIVPGQSTAYIRLNAPISSAMVSFTNEGEQKWAGYLICGTPEPSVWPAGKYTFVIRQRDNEFYPEIIQE